MPVERTQNGNGSFGCPSLVGEILQFNINRVVKQVHNAGLLRDCPVEPFRILPTVLNGLLLDPVIARMYRIWTWHVLQAFLHHDTARQRQILRPNVFLSLSRSFKVHQCPNRYPMVLSASNKPTSSGYFLILVHIILVTLFIHHGIS